MYRTRTSRWLRAATLAVVIAALASLALTSTGLAAGSPVSNCGWPIKNDANVENIAYPDQSATYWGTPFEAVPGTDMTITGNFPLARYMSFSIYEGDEAVDELTDDNIAPSTGTNPYVVGAPRSSDGTYTIHIVLGDPPAHRAANTLYAGDLNGELNLAGVILYRQYLPQGSATGGVPLPTVSYSDATSGVVLPCADTSALDSIAVNSVLAQSSSPLPSSDATTSLSWGVNNSHTGSKLTLGTKTINTNYDGNFNNKDNTYLSLLTEKIKGDVVAFRAKAPTYVQTVGATSMPSGQVRYFSICTNEFASTRYIQCLPDQSIKIDSQGYFTMVLSDTDAKPDNLTPLDNWIPDGAYPDLLVLYRQMVPSASFTQASANVLAAADAPKQMGAYYPETVQCSTADFEQNRCGLPAPSGPATTTTTTTTTSKSCAKPARLHFAQHPASPVRETRAVVLVNGRTVLRLARHRITVVTVKRPTASRFTITLTATLSDGEVVRHSYRYAGCRERIYTVVLHR